jgi:hypothetical protein
MLKQHQGGVQPITAVDSTSKQLTVKKWAKQYLFDEVRLHLGEISSGSSHV